MAGEDLCSCGALYVSEQMCKGFACVCVCTSVYICVCVCVCVSVGEHLHACDEQRQTRHLSKNRVCTCDGFSLSGDVGFLAECERGRCEVLDEGAVAPAAPRCHLLVLGQLDASSPFALPQAWGLQDLLHKLLECALNPVSCLCARL